MANRKVSVSFKPWLGHVFLLALADKQIELENEFHYTKEREPDNSDLHWKLMCKMSQVEELIYKLQPCKHAQ